LPGSEERLSEPEIINQVNSIFNQLLLTKGSFYNIAIRKEIFKMENEKFENSRMQKRESLKDKKQAKKLFWFKSFFKLLELIHLIIKIVQTLLSA
jgi:hypothetical protein